MFLWRKRHWIFLFTNFWGENRSVTSLLKWKTQPAYLNINRIRSSAKTCWTCVGVFLLNLIGRQNKYIRFCKKSYFKYNIGLHVSRSEVPRSAKHYSITNDVTIILSVLSPTTHWNEALQIVPEKHPPSANLVFSCMLTHATYNQRTLRRIAF